MANADLGSLRQILQRRFGLTSLREGQEEVISLILAGKDTLAVMPTGAGKSLCYQLAGCQLSGATVVVTPLLSLMKDQMDKMADLGLRAAQVRSGLAAEEERAVLDRLSAGRARGFVFVTPERLAKPEFLVRLKRNRVDLLVIDEAHCLSQWGHDFRPAYLRLRHAIETLGQPTVLALTATATPRVIEDIRGQLGRDSMAVVHTGIYRENLTLAVVSVASEEEKRGQLLRLIARDSGPGIVYTSTVRDCRAVSELLATAGHRVIPYHGRLTGPQRRAHHDQFMRGAVDWVVATNAFGMGIDKPDIRYVVHYNLPGSLEAYYQEAGRAGRDGKAARCVLLHLPRDRATQIFFLNGRYPARQHFSRVLVALKRLGAMEHPVTAGAVQAEAKSVAKAKVSVALDRLKSLDALGEPAIGRFRLLQPRLAPTLLQELEAEYRQRAAGDRQRLQDMIQFAQTRLCRWSNLLAYFDPETPGDEGDRAVLAGPAEDGKRVVERCGHCDNCLEPSDIAMPDETVTPPSYDTAPRVLAEGSGALMPLPPLLGNADPAALQPGDPVALPLFGAGAVRSADAGTIEVELTGGEIRRFGWTP
jgi:ATP-dependent DNA helicase RecQ